ncbi:MAG: hypothetical protein Q9191_006098 [Dirinaria sp. TL-2023a]
MSHLLSRPFIVNHYAHLQHNPRHNWNMVPFVPDGPRRAKLASETNVPESFELFILGDNEKKVTEEIDTRIPSTSIFTFNKEDHTLGNMIRARLLQNRHVNFSGYKVPHPLVASFELRVGTDGSISPRAAVVQACRELVTDLGTMNREFTKEYELRKMVSEGMNGNSNGI